MLLESVHESVYGMAIFELLSERMVDQLHPRPFLIVLQGSVEERLKMRARSVTHRNRWEICRVEVGVSVLCHGGIMGVDVECGEWSKNEADTNPPHVESFIDKRPRTHSGS